MNLGDAFLITDYYGIHQHIVLAVLSDQSVITVPVSTRTPRKDATIVLNPGEHPFITRESVALYYRADRTPAVAVPNLENLIRERFEPVGNDLLQRLIQGALDSPQTADKIKKLLR